MKTFSIDLNDEGAAKIALIAEERGVSPSTVVLGMICDAIHPVEIMDCQHCGKRYAAGALTMKRTNSMFCSNRCRVASQRAKLKD